MLRSNPITYPLGGMLDITDVSHLKYLKLPKRLEHAEITLSTKVVEDLLAAKFIARKDVKAVQHNSGKWSPHQEYNELTGRNDGPRIGWRRRDLTEHIAGTSTFGHYLLDTSGQCKLVAFDIDLEKTGHVPDTDAWGTPDEPHWFEENDLRGAWLNRAHPQRTFFKYQFRMLAEKLTRAAWEELELPVAVAYSGAKGIHVYCFTGLISGEEARRAGRIILDSVGNIEPMRGKCFYKHSEFPNLSIEMYPKQESLDGKDLGNLLRLPLGRNLKSSDPTFFIDLTAPLTELRPIDAEIALTKVNPWQ
jgi:hypothetical protein